MTRRFAGAPFQAPGPRCSRIGAFTLIEMLVVLVIIGILAALALPHIRGNLESRAIDAASRQVLEDISFARQKAISQRSTVAIVFLPFEVLSIPYGSQAFNAKERETVKRLQSGAYTSYALFGFRHAGDQPGARTAAYLTEWKNLPEKTFFGTNQFLVGSLTNVEKFPFPFSDSNFSQYLPYIAFDAEGHRIDALQSLTGYGVFPPISEGFSSALPHAHVPEDIDLEMARGAIMFVRFTSGPKAGAIDPASFQLQETPFFNATQNVIHIDALTGRAKWLKAELK